MASSDADTRMSGLERILVFALGDRTAEFGETESRIQSCVLPSPLARFYRFAGRWPVPHPRRSPILFETPAEGYFYAGVQHAHLMTLEDLKSAEHGRIAVFWEQAGNWTGATETEGNDPLVWVQGTTGLGSFSEPVESGETLSGWLVSHCLGALAWETANSYCCATLERRPIVSGHTSGLLTWFESDTRQTTKLWKGRQTICHELSGTFFSFNGEILVHECGNLVRMAAFTRGAAEQMHERATSADNLE